MYEINLTPENHGYTIRLEKRTFTDGGKKEISETIATLAIIWDYKEAHAAFDALNVLISVCAENKIFDEDLFRYRTMLQK
jgi:hypothetical protein